MHEPDGQAPDLSTTPEDRSREASAPEVSGRHRGRRGRVGMTGARFGSASLRQRWADDEGPEPDESEYDPEPTDPGIGRTGARFGPPALRRQWREDTPEEPPPAGADVEVPRPAEGTPEAPVTQPAEEWPPPKEAGHWSLVRPYARTAGRTHSEYELALETLVSARPETPGDEPLSPQSRSIVELCARPRSVAEVAALLSVPLGVARVLVGDLAATNALVIHGGGHGSGAPDRALLERVLSGLRRL
ncbi:hypothetical protein GCM10012275_37170 [Longimycelium tulufanense]|uniref:DUF742 domain-containing protein n=1 Tax=Longimycelium tulufanense TaxID=907463 RepID=A0A8J3FVE8_9PSEU|nr:DUF742 domain-containing protein [Longimycelium tulufanense]GGM63083.1 hypothetical protein GCM10012275_37170 [Longimycelium tulufanense]